MSFAHNSLAPKVKSGKHLGVHTGWVGRILVKIKQKLFILVLPFLSFALVHCGQSGSSSSDAPIWTNRALASNDRARALLKAMSQDEKFKMVLGYFATDDSWRNWKRPVGSLPDSAGYIPGVERLGIPAQWQTDAGNGVATQKSLTPRGRTALPSGLATASTWNRALAFAGGAMIGNEARLSGFNVQLAGAINLLREPRNGRNFEYAGEDPILAGVMVGEEIRGIQSNHILSTIKHFALNDQETNRGSIDVHIDETAARMSDLLAFEVAIEIGHPGSVMCSYNRVNGFYTCENDWLLNQVLKKDWGFAGFVMSDWGAVHSTVRSALSGLDQESGFPFDNEPYFKSPLATAIANGQVSQARFDDMVFRILNSLFATGVFDYPVAGDQSNQIDFVNHAHITQSDAEEAIVLLKNENDLLPLNARLKKIAVIGSHADLGVLSGGGSSQVYPQKPIPVPNEGPENFPGPMVYYPSSPLRSLAARLPATFSYNDGKDVDSAVRLAESSDAVLIFATQWAAESVDLTSLHLPGSQDEMISRVSASNKKTIVVLETGGPVLMPWLANVPAVLEAWYPGTEGAEALARILTGEVNPSGHLPLTFPASEAQLPRAKVDGNLQVELANVSTDYNIEGAAVGYKWFALKNLKPLFAFGYGRSYTQFEFSNLQVKVDQDRIVASFQSKNIGSRTGQAVPQIYVSAHTPGVFEAPFRLAGWDKFTLNPGQIRQSEVIIDRRSLSVYNSKQHQWQWLPGDYQFTLGESSTESSATQSLHYGARNEHHLAIH